MIEAEKISKSFPGVQALSGVSLKLEAGECVGLLGENGSGKSTLAKIMAGVYPVGTYEGVVKIDGRAVSFLNTLEARNAGVSLIHQELNQFPDMSVSDNLFLTMEPLIFPRLRIRSRSEAQRMARDLLRAFDLNIDVDRPIGSYSVGIQQIIEICKAVHTQSHVMIFDEPTSALTEKETRHLFTVIQTLKRRGTALAYISHRLEEIFEITERITILRDGVHVASLATRDTNQNDVVTAMVGRELKKIYPLKRPKAEGRVPLLKTEMLSGRSTGRATNVQNIHIDVHSGEIVGLAGLMGSGRSEVLQLIFGAYPGQRSGNILLQGAKTDIKHPRQAKKLGIAFLTEDRKATGLFLGHSIERNATVASLRELSNLGWLDVTRARESVKTFQQQLRIKMPTIDALVSTLSGGNQQKVLLEIGRAHV